MFFCRVVTYSIQLQKKNTLVYYVLQICFLPKLSLTFKDLSFCAGLELRYIIWFREF